MKIIPDTNTKVNTDLKTFLDSLFKEGETIELRFIDSCKKEKPIVQFVKYDDKAIDKINGLIQKYNDVYEAYFGVNPRKDNSSSSISRLQVLYCDIDLDKMGKGQEYVEELKKKLADKLAGKTPSFIINTGHGVHFYFLLKEPLELTEEKRKSKDKEIIIQKNDDWLTVTKSLIWFCQSDKSIKDLPRILRLPTSKNNKDRANPKECKIVECTGHVFTPADFKGIVGEHIESEKDKSKQIEKNVNGDYSINEAHDLKDAVIKTLEQYGSNLVSDYYDFIRLIMSFKVMGCSYDEIDCIFRLSEGYDYDNNMKLFNNLKPNGEITGKTAYFFAKEANEQYLKSLLPKRSQSKETIESDKEKCLTEKLLKNRSYDKNKFYQPKPKNYKTWGVGSLDNIFYKPRYKEYIFIVGLPSSGKTAFTLQMAVRNAQNGVKTLFASLEMCKNDVIDRYTETLSGIPEEKREDDEYVYTDDIREEVDKYQDEANNPNLLITDNQEIPGLNSIDILLKECDPFSLCIIDNFGFIRDPNSKGGLDEQETISRKILEYVNRTGKTIILLHHYAKGQQKEGSSMAMGRGSQKLVDDSTRWIRICRNEDQEATDEEKKMVNVAFQKDRWKGKHGEIDVYYDNGRYRSQPNNISI